jgi:pimeloyl-ACP methyl ester carboxylesterase
VVRANKRKARDRIAMAIYAVAACLGVCLCVLASAPGLAENSSHNRKTGSTPDAPTIVEVVDQAHPVNGMREMIVSNEGLEGIFVRPDTDRPCPAVLIIAGSGPTDRNGNNPLGVTAAPYKMLANSLAAAGIASLRYDKRGIGRSADSALRESDLRFDTFIDDAANWTGWLAHHPGVGAVFLLGHSEGALIASVVANRIPVAGVVLTAGVGRRPGDLLRAQFAAVPMPEPLRTRANAIIAELEAGHTVDDVPAALVVMFRLGVQPFLISWMRLDPPRRHDRSKLPC